MVFCFFSEIQLTLYLLIRSQAVCSELQLTLLFLFRTTN